MEIYLINSLFAMDAAKRTDIWNNYSLRDMREMAEKDDAQLE